MREIKFRAWDKEDEEWLYAEPIYGFFPSLPMSEVVKQSDRYGDIQQYTGLKDKNGKEIYEGDIIKREGREWWSDNDDTQITIDDITALPTQCGDWSIYIEDYEVIGNIYENTELIEN